MSLPSPIRFTPSVETFQPDEAETVRGLNDTFDTILKRTSEDYGHAVRSVHAKAHGILAGELTVDSDLPPELSQGLFAKPGAHKMFMRMSTNAGDILPDVISLPRGLAIKVLDVAGDRLPGGRGHRTRFRDGQRPDVCRQNRGQVSRQSQAACRDHRSHRGR